MNEGENAREILRVRACLYGLNFLIGERKKKEKGKEECG